MPIGFNSILLDCGLAPADVRLVRHKDQRSSPGNSPYELWRDRPHLFDEYQSRQKISNRKKFSAPYWAVFVADAFNDTMFAGIYSAAYKGLLEHDRPKVQTAGEVDEAGSCDVYDLALSGMLGDLIGRLFIDWGGGERAWVQYAERQNKEVKELRLAEYEPPFPGHMNIREQLSRIGKLPRSWIEVLKYSKGVYVLTCPRTKEQYIGSAKGAEGFYSRWMSYFRDGHGGNVALKSRDPSNYQVSILEVAGSSVSDEEIQAMEGRWQLKLQSREMGLNRNLAKS